MVEAELKHYLANGANERPDAREAIEWAGETHYKREHEVDAVRLRPHPAEFALYFDC